MTLGECIDEITQREHPYRLRTVGHGQVRLDVTTELNITGDWKPTFSVMGGTALIAKITSIWLADLRTR